MLLALIIYHLVYSLANAKVYDRCELAKELRHVHGFPEEQIPTWVCIAQHESLLNTSAMNRGSGDHGLFQISQIYWCSPPGHGCNTPCASFRDDDIADDVRCIRKIFKEHTRISGDGFNAWVVYQLYCKGDTSKYTGGCLEDYVDNSINVIDVATGPADEDDDGYDFPALPAPPKVYDRCELARELRDAYRFPHEQISKWVCIAAHESSYNTSALGRGDHGIFQISELFWCSPSGRGNGCNVNCASFRDSNIADDIACAKAIYDEHTGISGDGFNAWAVYPLFCKGDTSRYVSDCFETDKQYHESEDGYVFPKVPSKPRVYSRCELAKELRDVYEFPQEQISKWVCIVEHESNYNTSALGRGDHGLFQISEQYWCSPSRRGLACNANCASFRDNNIADDVRCVKNIYYEHTAISGDGFDAWTVYPLYCKGDTSRYVSGCFETNEHDDGYQFPQLPITSSGVLENVIDGAEDDGYEFPALPSFAKSNNPYGNKNFNMVSVSVPSTARQTYSPTTRFSFFDKQTTYTPIHITSTPPSPRARHITFRPLPSAATTASRPGGSRPRPPGPVGGLPRPSRPPGSFPRPSRPTSCTARPNHPTHRPPPPPPAGPIFTLWPTSTISPVSTSVYGNRLKRPSEAEKQKYLGGVPKTSAGPSSTPSSRVAKAVFNQFPGYSFSRSRLGFSLFQNVH